MASLVYHATIYEFPNMGPNYVCSIIIQATSYTVRNYGKNGVYLFCNSDATYKWSKLIGIDDHNLTIKKNKVFYTFTYSFQEEEETALNALKSKIIAAVYPNGNIHTSPTEGLRF